MTSKLIEFRRGFFAEYKTAWEKVRDSAYRTLYDRGYPCPSYERKTLHFERAGLWD